MMVKDVSGGDLKNIMTSYFTGSRRHNISQFPFFFFERFERKINEARAIAFMLGTCSAECFTKTEINKQKIFDSAM